MRKIKSITLALIVFLFFIICQQNFYNSRIPLSLSEYNPPENSSNLTKWGYDMSYAALKVVYEHPEWRTDLHPKYGILGNVILVLRYPENLVQSTVESTIFLLPGFLGYILGMLLSRIIKIGRTFWPWVGFYVFLFLMVLGNIYVDHKHHGISFKIGWYFPIAIILIYPAFSLIVDLWRNEKIAKEKSGVVNR
ncbi:MAG TPA: hypothetical protein ENH94_05350 [Phycisphaerales bacterium]|nr:hypothetical protein [Phycisphaerales bacterium]